MSIVTYSTAEAAEQIGAPSERWLIEHLRSGRFPGRKVGRHWRLTDQDIADVLDVCRNDASRAALPVVTPIVGLTPTSRKKVVGPWPQPK
jgi:hypothetical protein